MGEGETLRVIAEDEEVGGVLGLDVTNQHAVHVGHLRPGPQLVGDYILYAAHRDVHHTGLGEHQVSLAAPGHSGVASAHPLGHCPQRDNSRHADGDAQQCQDRASFTPEEVLENHIYFLPAYIPYPKYSSRFSGVIPPSRTSFTNLL